MGKRLPDRYIKTSTSGFLVFLKLLEVLLAVFLAVFYILKMDAIQEIIQQQMAWRSLFGMGDSYRAYMNAAVGILIVNAVLMILDGLACFLLRTIKKGAIVVAICHLVRCIVLGIATFICAYSVFSRPSSTYSLINNNPLFLIGLPYFITGNLLYIGAGIERIVGMIIVAVYHASVFRMMLRVSRELKAGELLYTDESIYKLGKRASNIGIFIIIGVIVDLIAGNPVGTILAAHALFTEPIYFMFNGISVACVIIMAFIIIKFFVVGGCAAEFQSAHLGVDEVKETEKTDVTSEEAGSGEAEKNSD